MAPLNTKKVKQGLGYWKNKKPCWELLNCPELMRNRCPVYKNRDIPGWQVGGLYCQLLDSRQTKRNFTDVCRRCPVYLRWGNHSLN